MCVCVQNRDSDASTVGDGVSRRLYQGKQNPFGPGIPQKATSTLEVVGLPVNNGGGKEKDGGCFWPNMLI